MRAPTLSTPRPPRAQPPADPACPADHPLPGMPPPRQPTRARRAAQPPRRQPPLDHARINAYRDHWCLRAPRAALPLLGQEKGGRAAAYPDVITVASHTKKDNPAGLPSSPSLPPTAPGSTPASSSSGTTGLSVRVKGTRLVDAAGNTLKLHGANISGLENTAIQNWTTNPWGDADMGTEPTWSKLVSWHMNAVRLPLNETSWLGHTCINPNTGASQNPDPGGNYRATVEKSVTDAVAAGLYVILDLHWTAPGTYCATGQAQMANTDNSIAFWTSIASTFKGNPAVLFELFNEPFGQNVYPVASSDWNILLNGGTYSSFVHQNTDTGFLETTNGSWQAAGMQAMLNAVRATGATNVVLPRTMGWH